MGLFDFFKKSKKQVDDATFGSAQYQNEILALAETTYRNSGHDYALTSETLKAEGLDDEQCSQVISQLREHVSKLVRDFETESESGRITELEIQPNPAHTKGEVTKEQVDKYIGYGAFQLQRGDLDNALELFDKALALDDTAALAYANKGSLYSMKGDREQALHFFDRALEFEQNDKKIYINKALVLDDLNRIDEAVIAYKKAVALDPKDSQALNNLAIAYLKKDEHATALQYLNSALELDPADSDVLINKLVAL